jgi:hypothetical protein
MSGRQSWKVSFRSSESLRARDQRGEPAGNAEGQHPCARGAWCADLTVSIADDGSRVTSPKLTRDVFCQRCRDSVWRALGDIPELWVRLHCELGSKGQHGERVSMSRSAPIPLRGDIDALLREHLDILASWDERVRLAAGLTLPDTQEMRLRPDHGRIVAALTRTLAAHLDRLLLLPADAMSRSFGLHDLGRIPEGAYGRTNRIGGYAEVTVDLSGADAGGEILGLRYRSRSRLGETRMTERLDVPCPDPACDMLMLERQQGSNYAAECRACGRLLTDQEYHQWVNLYASTVSTADVDQIRASFSAA